MGENWGLELLELWKWLNSCWSDRARIWSHACSSPEFMCFVHVSPSSRFLLLGMYDLLGPSITNTAFPSPSGVRLSAEGGWDAAVFLCIAGRVSLPTPLSFLDIVSSLEWPGKPASQEQEREGKKWFTFAGAQVNPNDFRGRTWSEGTVVKEL